MTKYEYEICEVLEAQIKESTDPEFKITCLEKLNTIKYNRQDNIRKAIKDYSTIACGVAGIVVPALIYNLWMKRGFEFEKEGTYTSTTFRNMFSKFKPN